MLFGAIEARIKLEKNYQCEKENEATTHNHKVGELFHFLQTQESKHKTGVEENVLDCTSPIPGSLQHHLKKSKVTTKNMIDNKKREIKIKRSALKEKHMHSKRKSEQRMFVTRDCKDEEERISYLRQKRKEILMKKRKEESIEQSKRAWSLSKLHYSLTLLRKYLTVWKACMDERRLLLTKAVRFSNELTMGKYFYALYHYVKDRRIRDDRMRFQNAG